jgi:hypothetical protein
MNQILSRGQIRRAMGVVVAAVLLAAPSGLIGCGGDPPSEAARESVSVPRTQGGEAPKGETKAPQGPASRPRVND